MTPSSFHPVLTTLQIAWDKTSLGALMFCPRYYQHSILEGWRSDSVDLTFGGYFASAVEVYLKTVLESGDKEKATREALRWTIDNSGEWVDKRVGGDEMGARVWLPWGGDYERLWRCKGEAKYKNPKGNAAKCPYSHKGKWYDSPQPEACGECGGETESEIRYLPDSDYKNRHNLVRAVYEYCMHQPEAGEVGAHPVRMPDGSPAVELSFTIPLPWSYLGTRYMLCGHIDSLKAYAESPVTLGEALLPGEAIFGSDNKTTTKTLGKSFFDSYASSLDVSVYGLALDLLYPGCTDGMMIEGTQLTIDGGVRCAFQPYYISKAQHEEFFRELEYYIKAAEGYAEKNYWPKNRRNCWICPFKTVCVEEPERRQAMLAEKFEKRMWNPLEVRT